jgi:predicted nucleic acid-binding protein
MTTATRFSGALLDSVILIDLLNGVEAADRYLQDREGTLHISAITRAEVLAGLDAAQFAKVRAFLDRFPLHAIDAQVADEAARLKRIHRWKLPDALQAACALVHRHRLVTRNTKDFDPGKFPWIEVPYTISPGS